MSGTSEQELPAGTLAGMLDDVTALIDEYMYLPSEYHAAVVALFAAYTHVAQEFDVAAYLHVSSPEKRCGKSLLLDLLTGLVASPLLTANISPAALYRSLEKWKGTPLVDEVDQVFSRQKASGSTARELQSILNAGYRRGSHVVRMGGSDFKEIDKHDVFGPKVLAGIGELPDTVADRCIPIRLERKPPQEARHKFRLRYDLPRFEAQRERLSEVLSDEALRVRIAEARPDLPGELHGRALDIWEALVALADEAGGRWPQLARDAAVALHGSIEDSGGSVGLELLGDIRLVWPDERKEVFTRDLLRRLHRLDESPWAEWNGRELSAHMLGRLLKPYGIRSHKMRIGGDQARGYWKIELERACYHYLPNIDDLPSHVSQTPNVGRNGVGDEASPDRPTTVPIETPNDAGRFSLVGLSPDRQAVGGQGTLGTDGTPT